MSRTTPDQASTWDADGPPLFTVWGCPLMTRVTADHPYFANLEMKVPLMTMDLGQIATGRLSGVVYSVERVR